jgi:hypothetical protein
MRISYQAVPLSKEILRQIYKKDPWYEELEQAKLNYKDNFREKVSSPNALSENTIFIVSEIYHEVQSLIVSGNKNTEYLDRLIKDLKNEHNNLW